MERQIQLISAMKKSERTSDSKKLYNSGSELCEKSLFSFRNDSPDSSRCSHSRNKESRFSFCPRQPSPYAAHDTHKIVFNPKFILFSLSSLSPRYDEVLSGTGRSRAHQKNKNIFSSDFGSWLISQSPLDTAHTPGFGQHQLALPMRNFVAEKDLPDTLSILFPLSFSLK